MNSFSLVTQRTDARSIVTTYGYDGMNRLTQVSYSDTTPAVTFAYGTSAASNSNGRLTSMTEGTGSDAYAYDLLGRWTSADPLTGSCSNPQSLNRYAYVTNSPTNFVDPTGLYPCSNQERHPTSPAPGRDCSYRCQPSGDHCDCQWVCGRCYMDGVPCPDGGRSRAGNEKVPERAVARAEECMINPTAPGCPPPRAQPSNDCAKKFDECTEKAWSNFRTCKATYPVIGGIAGVGVGLVVGGVLDRIGVPIAPELGVVGGIIGGGWGGILLCIDDYDRRLAACWADLGKCK